MDLKPITRQEQIIAGKDLEPITRMERFLKEYGGASSWNDLTDKPFGEETVTVNEPLNITWDGNTEGLVSVEGFMYKVSDLVLADEQIKLCAVQKSNSSPMPVMVLWGMMVGNGDVTEEIVNVDFAVMFVRKAGAVVQGVAFPETGIYFSKNDVEYVSSLTTTEPIQQTETVVKPIDLKYLPIEELKAALGLNTPM